MTWMDEQNFEARIRSLRNRGRYQIPLNLKVAERLVKEARKLEKIRKAEVDDCVPDAETFGAEVYKILAEGEDVL